MRVVHPVADEWTEDYAVYAASSRSVLLSEPLSLFLQSCTDDHLIPILVTDTDARISPFTSMAMYRSGGYWAVRDAAGVAYDGLTGRQLGSFAELWAPPTEDRPRLTELTQLRDEPLGVLMFDVFAHQRASATTLVGRLGQDLVGWLGGSQLRTWDLTEPLARPWSERGMSEIARLSMPESPHMHAQAEDFSFCDTQVARTPRGLLEHAKGGVPIGAYPTTIADVVDSASRALTLLSERYQPTLAFVSLAETDPQMWQEVTAKRPEAPLAVLVGARAVHEMGVDVDEMCERHDATILGRRRVPSLLVRFSRPDEGLWLQLAKFAVDLGPENFLSAAGFKRRD